MELDADRCFLALAARDARFDGLFFVGVSTTGIYCRPICPARTPRRDRCRFFASAAAAEVARFRPCLRCRPELAPGSAPVDDGARVARRAMARIAAGALDDGRSVDELADEFELSARQLRRIVVRELGATPVDLAQTHRLLLAKQLLAETRLPIVEVAIASGFASLRRFNALFRLRYRLAPSEFRRRDGTAAAGESIHVALAFRPPLAWRELVRFLADRAIAGVELVTEASYARTVLVGAHRGVVSVAPVAGQAVLDVTLSTSLLPVLAAVLARLRDLFDLNARPDAIDAHLRADPRLRPLVDAVPGLRVPGAFDPFELGVRAILGQQVSVRAARTMAGRLVSALGDDVGEAHHDTFDASRGNGRAPRERPQAAARPRAGARAGPGSSSRVGSLRRLFPSPERLAGTRIEAFVGLGLIRRRAECIGAFADAVMRGRVRLEPGIDPMDAIEALMAIPGIGEWTAHAIAMRALRWPDAFPHRDLALRKALGGTNDDERRRQADAWRPWRSYAAMHLWRTTEHS